MFRSSLTKRSPHPNNAHTDNVTSDIKTLGLASRSASELILVLIIFIMFCCSQMVVSETTTDNYRNCHYNYSCVYGEMSTAECVLISQLRYSVSFPCLYCWQLPEESYVCAKNTTCKLNTRYLTTCRVNSNIHCLGRREFNRYKNCEPATGHKWSLALVLSILFGGFGVDRFYLGHWQEGVGKLFSFGGFGVWTLIDTILIAIGYLKPADSSRYD